MQKRPKARKALTILGASVGVALSFGALGLVGLLRLSLPRLDGVTPAPELSAPVTVARDALGAPTIRGRTRQDLAFALGYLHAQERFFQMDLQRRAAAGELSDLFGPAALERDRAVRIHRFRRRAAAAIAAMAPTERQLIDAYVRGVNQGLGDLGAPPFEYLLLFKTPSPWTAEDAILTAYAMYLTLQEWNGATERRRGDAIEALGKPLADFLFPDGTDFDAPLDGTRLETPLMPAAGLKHAENAAPQWEAWQEPAVPGSNGFAVGGGLSARGAAIVANDMHLGLRTPNIWYRARLAVEGSLDVTGVTLPGAPNLVAGSNGHVAWGFTNSYVDTSDVVILEQAEDDPYRYRTPDGPKELVRREERLCRTCAKPETITVEESIWGPVIGVDRQGRKLAYRWVAHDPEAVSPRGLLDLEQAKSAREALAIAHRMGIPHQNLVAGDVDGNIGWTVTSPLPRRFGFDGRTPTSWADGDKGWNGYVAPEDVPVVYDPADERIWTANARVLGGEALKTLGFGAYAHGARARQIRDDLFAKSQFREEDLLAIELDDRGLVLRRWRDLLLQSLQDRAARPQYAELLPQVAAWSDHAAPESVGYRLVRAFRLELISAIYGRYLATMPVIETPAGARPQSPRLPTNQADEPAWRLLSERPAALVPPGFKSWDAVVDAALEKLLLAIKTEAGGRLEAFTWGATNRAGVKHPLSQVLPVLGVFLDPPDEAQPGDIYQPRVASPGFGASERFIVAPGHEATGLWHMPTGQSGHPLSPYYNLGHDDWAKGRPTPFLPGAPKWTLTFEPA